MTISATIHIVALVLAGTPIDGLVIRDGGYRIGPSGWKATELNCGTNLTCRQNGPVVTIDARASTSDAGSTPQIALDAGYWVAWADPNLSAEKNLGALSTGLVINTAGTPSAYAGSTCGAGTYASATSASGALTCGTPAGVPGGSDTQVQYNNAGAFGGVSKVESDGTNQRLVGQTSHPTAPAVGKTTIYGFSLDAGYPSPVFPMLQDGYMGLPTPVGLFKDFSMTANSAWQVSCCMPAGWSGSVTPVCSNLAGQGAMAVAGSSTAPAWASTNIYTRSRAAQAVTASNAANLNAGYLIQSGLQFWRGDSAGAGGFIYWTRVRLVGVTADQRAFFGLISRTSVLTASVDPSTFPDTVYVGADHGAANLSICSDDNSTPATCNTLGADFPSTTAGATYDIWIYAAPNAGTIEWAIFRLDSAVAPKSGSITTDLPRNTVQLAWQNLLNTGAAGGGTTVTLGFLGSCMASNY